MKVSTTVTCGVWSALVFGCLIVLASLCPAGASEQAGRADDFVERIAINIKSPSYGNYALVYSNTTLVKSKLAELGVRYYRVNAKDVDDDWAFCRDIYATHGIKADMQVTWTFSSLSNRLQTNAIMLASVEGPNETDNPGLAWTYNGLGFPAGVINFQNDLFTMVKGGPATQNLPLIIPSVANPTNQSKLIGCLGDYENMHSYPAGNITTTFLDGLHITNANTVFSPPKSIVVTETGYHTARQAGAAVSEKAQGKYMPRLFAEYWNRTNIARVYAYELFDEGVDQTDAEMTYGILHNDGTAKPAFTAEKNLMARLKEPGVSFNPGALDYSLSGSTNKVHHVLLQKSNSDFYLLLWQEVLCYNPSTKTDIANADAAVTLAFATSITNAVSYRFDDAGNLGTNTVLIVGNTMNLSVPDTVLLVKLSPNLAVPPPIPNAISAAAGNMQVLLNWTASAGASGYNLKRTTVSGGGYTTIANIPTTSFTETGLTNGTTYYYVVSATNANGESSNSMQVSATPAPGVPPPAPADLIVTARSASQNNLVWISATGAISYNVKRSTNGTGPYAIIASNVTVTNYADANLINGVTYYYTVSAVNMYGESPDSLAATADIIKDNADVTGIVVIGSWSSSSGVAGYYGTNYLFTGGGSGASVRFTPNLPATNDYDVYLRWTTNSNRATNVTVDVIYATGTNMLKIDQQVNGGVWVWGGTYKFAAGSAGSAVVRNDGANGIVVADAVKFVQKIPPATPANLTATSVSSSQINLAWAASGGAASYNIKRATNSSGTYAIVATNVTSLNYPDLGLSAAIKYYYVVSALGATGESSDSAPASAMPNAPVLGFTFLAGSIQLSITGQAGVNYQLQTATNLTAGNWDILTNFVGSNLLIQVTEPVQPRLAQRYYRLVLP